MKAKSLTRQFIYLLLCVFLVACGGGGSSSSGSGSDSSAIANWVGTWGLIGAMPGVCSAGDSLAGGDMKLKQNGEQISGTYSITVRCQSTSQSTTVSGTLASTSIQSERLEMVDDEDDVFTITYKDGLYSLRIENPATGTFFSLVALKK